MPRPKGSKNRSKAEIEYARALPKRPRGRPRKNTAAKDKYTVLVDQKIAISEKAAEESAKRGRGKRGKGGYTVTNEVLETRRSSNSIIPADSPEGMEFNSRLIAHIMQIHEIASRADRSDINTLKSCFVAYLKLCQADGFSVSNLAAYSAMGFYSAQHFENYCKKDDPERKEFAGLVKSTCAMFRESLVQNNKLNPVIGIFWQRNYDGLRNDTEQIQNALEQDETYVNGTKAYKEKYRNLIGE